MTTLAHRQGRRIQRLCFLDSVDGGLSGAGKAALDKMNPLCMLRDLYSASRLHVDFSSL